MTIRNLSEIKPNDPSVHTLRFNRTLADAGLSSGPMWVGPRHRPDRIIGRVAAIGLISMLAIDLGLHFAKASEERQASAAVTCPDVGQQQPVRPRAKVVM
jgi:hypothetical protein